MSKLPIIIKDFKLFHTIDSYMKMKDTVAIDTETNGLHRFRRCIGLSFSFGVTYFYIPILKWNGFSLENYWVEDLEVRKYIKGWLSDKSKKWVGHNLVFDIITLENEFGVNIVNTAFSDTALLHHTCISEDPPHSLKLLAAQFITPDAASAQEDLAESVKRNGGIWKKDNKEFYKGDMELLGTYGALDPKYTYDLHKIWYPEIKSQGLNKIWFEEVLPLTKVMYQLNSTGLGVEPGYFEKLQEELVVSINKTEDTIYESAKDELHIYEITKILGELTITPRSALGKALLDKGLVTFDGNEPNLSADANSFIVKWYLEKNKLDRVFNLASKLDLAFLLFEVLKLPINKKTKTGAPATDKATLDALLEEIEESDSNNEILKSIKLRSKEMKLLNTYVLPIIENTVNGRIYPQFNQIGTSSGRFTSSEPINFQTLPRDDLRIKRGFIPDEGYVFVNADFSALEPRIFADRSNEQEIQRVYTDHLDLYSHVYKMVFKDDSVSAKEDDANYLKKVNPSARNLAKAFTLALAYGVKEYRLASLLGKSVEEAKEVIESYFEAFPNLKVYQEECKANIETEFYVSNLMGRRKRAKLIKLIKSKFKVNTQDKYKMYKAYDRLKEDPEFLKIADALKMKGKPIKNAKDFAYAVSNEYNNSLNFPIQSLAASVANASCIEVLQAINKEGLDAKVVLQIHDEITLMVKKEHADRAVELLQYAMENNKVAKMLVVKMKAEPIIAMNLAEAK